MQIPYKNYWYFWSDIYPEYEFRLEVMAGYVQTEIAQYIVDNVLKLVPKE